MTDLPAPPLVENTVMTRPTLAVVVEVGRDRPGVGRDMMSPAATRATASASCVGLDRGLEDVLDPGPERPLEQLGGELVGRP